MKGHGERSRKPLVEGSDEFTSRVRNIIQMHSIEKSSGEESNCGTQKNQNAMDPARNDGGLVSPTWNEKKEERNVQMQRETIRGEMKSNAPGMHLREMLTSKQLPQGAIEETPAESSIGQLLTLEQERVASLSLIDESLNRLHLQMKRLTLREEAAPIEDKMAMDRAHLACKTASSMAQMIKLKLEAVKIFKTLRE